MHLQSTTTNSEMSGAKAQSMGYVVVLAATTAISGFLFGFDTAVINGVLFFLRRQFALSNLQTEVAASSLLLGCLLGAACASVIGDRYGRKKSLIASAVLFALSALGAAAANSIALFSAARLVGGLAIGLASVLTPVYIAEISPSKNRGTLVSLNQLAIVIGILSAYLVNWQVARLGESSWRWMLAVAAIPSLAFFVGLLAIPESPRWLLSRGRHNEGERILARIFGPAAARDQVQAVERAAAAEEGSWREVFSPNLRKRLGVAMFLALFCQITGINTVLYYGSIIVSEHFPGQSTNMALIANVTARDSADGERGHGSRTCASRHRPEYSGRIASPDAGRHSSLCCLLRAWHGARPWLIISEIFPTKVRGRAASIATSTLWSGTLIVTFTFLSLVKALNLSGTFAIYGALSFVCFAYVWKMVPETKGRTLEQIQEEWGK